MADKKLTPLTPCQRCSTPFQKKVPWQVYCSYKPCAYSAMIEKQQKRREKNPQLKTCVVCRKRKEELMMEKEGRKGRGLCYSCAEIAEMGGWDKGFFYRLGYIVARQGHS